jgi:RES domain-containing protein
VVIAYRLFQARFGPRDSTGARLRGGRWNSPGKDVLYASDSLALCCLEVLVHLRDTRFVPTFHYCSIDIPDELVEPWPFSPDNPRHGAILASEVLSQDFGDEFLDGGGSSPTGTIVERVDRFGTHALPVQVVPSVVMPWGTHVNFLLNPLNDNFNGLRWSEPQVFEFEPRLLNSHLR